MGKTFYVDCPGCGMTLEVDAQSGEIVEKWEKTEKAKGADALQDALRKTRDAQEKRKSLFGDAASELAKKKKKMLEGFGGNVKKAKEDGDERPMNPMDMD